MVLSANDWLFRLLDNLPLDLEEELDNLFSLLLRHLRELHADNRPAFPFHNWINNRHADILKNQNGRADHLTLVKHIEVLRTNQARAAASKFIDDRVDVDSIHA
jgi:hypothetical protein